MEEILEPEPPIKGAGSVKQCYTTDWEMTFGIPQMVMHQTGYS